jgi:hypothetical protein
VTNGVPDTPLTARGWDDAGAKGGRGKRPREGKENGGIVRKIVAKLFLDESDVEVCFCVDVQVPTLKPCSTNLLQNLMSKEFGAIRE